MNVKVDIDTAKILREHHLNDNAARRYLGNAIARFSDPYVPMQSGELKSAQVSGDGRQLVYPGPYAHYHWRGERMAGRAPKHYTGNGMLYHGAPMRGKEWVNRAMNDHRDDMVEDFANYVGGRKK